MANSRRQLWLNILEDLGPPEGCVLPGYLVACYILLFPLHGLQVLLNRANKFDIMRMSWNIHGLSISDRMLLKFATTQGHIYQVSSVDGVVTVKDLTYALPTKDDIEQRFQRWWFDEGSGMVPQHGMDHEEHVRFVSNIAWHNGAHVERYVRKKP